MAKAHQAAGVAVVIINTSMLVSCRDLAGCIQGQRTTSFMHLPAKAAMTPLTSLPLCSSAYKALLSGAAGAPDGTPGLLPRGSSAILSQVAKLYPLLVGS